MDEGKAALEGFNVLCDQLQKRIQANEDELARLRQELCEMRAENEVLRTRIRDLEIENAELRRRLEEMQVSTLHRQRSGKG